MERDATGVQAGAGHPVSDIELASRLSFFLWSSIPDQQLMDLAVAGRLRQPGVLAAQVRRMIADERANALVNNFVGQWLQLRNLEAKVAPDLLMFPDFDDNIRKAFRRETELFFGYILRENRSALELLSADYTFVNERLARHYGISGVYGSRFRQVKLTDPNRRGLLGQGSLLALTSVATRTSPVYRGKFVLATFMNTPPPPPLPNVPTLEESAKGAKTAPKTVRETLELHRASPVCASCHSIIDPPGFALENFNSVGQWRERTENGAAIDAAGVLADGTKVNGPVALRNAILSRPDAFATVLTERIMTYALGRGVEPSDMPVVRGIVRKASQSNYRLASIVQNIVESAPFQMRTRLEPEETPNSVASRWEVKDTAAMIITKKHLSRRTFLRGTFGAAMALPLLDAMVPALTAQGKTAARTPFRFGAIYMPNGVYPDTWHPDDRRRRLRVQAGHAAARDVPRSARDGQQDEGALGRISPPRRELGVPERDRSGRGRVMTPATRSARSSRRRPPISTSPTSSPTIRRCARSRSAPRIWAPRWARATASPAPSSTRSPGATTSARCRSASTRA